MNKKLTGKSERREMRRRRVRALVSGTATKPRLNVFRSLKNIFAQLIDDETGKTLVSIHSKNFKATGDMGERKGKTGLAFLMGKELAGLAVAKGILTTVFDRAGYRYHGRVKAFADGAREGGLKF